MGASVFEREHVVDLSHRSRAPSFEAVLAQWMCLDVDVADLSPAVVVASVDFRIPLLASVPGVVGLGMLRAEPMVDELRASSV